MCIIKLLLTKYFFPHVSVRVGCCIFLEATKLSSSKGYLIGQTFKIMKHIHIISGIAIMENLGLSYMRNIQPRPFAMFYNGFVQVFPTFKNIELVKFSLFIVRLIYL